MRCNDDKIHPFFLLFAKNLVVGRALPHVLYDHNILASRNPRNLLIHHLTGSLSTLLLHGFHGGHIDTVINTAGLHETDNMEKIDRGLLLSRYIDCLLERFVGKE